MSIFGNPTEYDAYGVITEAFILHKQPRERYIIFPQLRLRWNPDLTSDVRASLPDFCLGQYYSSAPYIRLQGGVEVKKALPLMSGFPSAATLLDEADFRKAVFDCIFQAEDQAKAAVKGGLLPEGERLSWLIFIGPYFTTINFGPFTKNQLRTRSHKPNDSGDFLETFQIEFRKLAEPDPRPMHLLGTQEAATELETFITSTAHFL